jgi:hypothetical protein
MTGTGKGHCGHRGGRFLILTALALASAGLGSAVLATAASAAAVPLNAPRLSASAAGKSQTAAAVQAYWTPARMAAAKPMAGAVAGSAGAAAATTAAKATGTPGEAGGYVPRGLSTVPGPPNKLNPNVQNSSVLPADGGFPGPNDTFDWYPRYRTYPVSTIGKLFFTEPGVGNFVCSASSTYGGNLDMVWTAGHCVGPQGGQSYYTNWEFCPSYVNGENAAVGCWTWANAQQTGGWYFNGQFSADYAYLYMSNCGDINCTDVINVTGGLGFAWNFGRDQIWQDFGYPSGSPYDGGAIVDTSAEHRYDVVNPDSCGSSCNSDNSIGSAQTPGFSGGPWILGFGSNTGTDPISHGNDINSDNSYYFTSGGPGGGNEYGTEIQGPYFDTNACNFWKGGSGYTGTC